MIHTIILGVTLLFTSIFIMEYVGAILHAIVNKIDVNYNKSIVLLIISIMLWSVFYYFTMYVYL